jgi:hypothetical protein
VAKPADEAFGIRSSPDIDERRYMMHPYIDICQ